MDTDPRKTVEHDVDILLIEEIHVSQNFREWLIQQARRLEQSDFGAFVGAWRSVSETILGESDVVFIYADANERKHSILIENKVSAPAQPSQAERYRLRGESGIGSAQWNDYTTVLLAPNEYLSASPDAEGFDVKLSYETLRDWFLASSRRDPRMEYKAGVIQRGINRMKNGWVREIDATATDFFQAYWGLASHEFPRLGVRKPAGVPKGHNEISYLSREIDSQRGFSLVHKFEKGCVDLRLRNGASRARELRQINRDLLGQEISVVRAGKSVAFRFFVPETMNRMQPFSKQVDVARKAMMIGIRLLELSFKLETE